MWRNILIIMFSFILAANFNVIASDNTEDRQYDNIIESIAPYVLDNENEEISRGDCIATIMKLIGVDRQAAEEYANAFYDEPVFYDIGGDKEHAGYIILAKFSDVAVGVNSDTRGIGNFEPNRNVTVKECLAFMLRCLKDIATVEWENIIADAEEVGLLTADEVQNINADEAIIVNTFKTLLGRMLSMNRYLYWPTEEPQPGHAKSMQIDISGSIKYIDWILQSSSN